VANSVIANIIAPSSVTGQETAIATGVDAQLIGEVTAIKVFAQYIGPIIMMGLFGNYFVSGSVLPIYFAYGGLLMEIIMSMLASAYAITKIVDAAIDNNSFYYGYAHGSNIGNYMGMWELLNVVVFLTWSLVIWILGWYVGFDLWTKFDELEKDGKLTLLAGFKYLLLGFITAAGIWVSGLNVGDMSSNMLGIFDTYNTKLEASNTDGQEDTAGTSLFIDLGVHLIETYSTMAVVSTIVIYAVSMLYQW